MKESMKEKIIEINTSNLYSFIRYLLLDNNKQYLTYKDFDSLSEMNLIKVAVRDYIPLLISDENDINEMNIFFNNIEEIITNEDNDDPIYNFEKIIHAIVDITSIKDNNYISLCYNKITNLLNILLTKLFININVSIEDLYSDFDQLKSYLEHKFDINLVNKIYSTLYNRTKYYFLYKPKIQFKHPFSYEDTGIIENNNIVYIKHKRLINIVLLVSSFKNKINYNDYLINNNLSNILNNDDIFNLSGFLNCYIIDNKSSDSLALNFNKYTLEKVYNKENTFYISQ